jgi:histidine triad (HIT) family protein
MNLGRGFNMEEKECIFCKIAKGEIPAKRIYDDDNFFGILDISPKAEGHTLIISKKHYKTLLDVPSSLGSELLDAVKSVGLNLIKEGKVKTGLSSNNEVEGFNFFVNNGEVAGQVVHHFHAHIIPRKKDDGLKSIV